QVSQPRGNALVTALEHRSVPAAAEIDLHAPRGGGIPQPDKQLDEGCPVGSSRRGRRKILERREVKLRAAEVLAGTLGKRRANTVEELEHPKRGNRIAGILRPAKNAEQALDVRRLEKTQSAVFHERDLPARKLHFQSVAVMGGSHQHRLLFQRDACLAVL